MQNNHIHRTIMCLHWRRGQCICMVCVCIRVQKVYRPIATWSDCSMMFMEHAQVHGHMETAQHKTEGVIIYYVYKRGPGPRYVQKETQL